MVVVVPEPLVVVSPVVVVPPVVVPEPLVVVAFWLLELLDTELDALDALLVSSPSVVPVLSPVVVLSVVLSDDCELASVCGWLLLSCVSSEELNSLGFELELDGADGLLDFSELVVLAVSAFCLDTKTD